MLRRLYDRTMSLAGHRHAVGWLAGVSFVESSVFPVPPDAMLVPMILKRPERAFYLATVCTLASVMGGWLGYAIGYALFETVGQWLIGVYDLHADFLVFKEWVNGYGAWAVLFAGVTPFPYKVITITVGVTQLDLVTFTMASILARGLRFYLEAALLWKFGPAIRSFIEERLGLVTTMGMILLIGGFLALKLF